MEGAEQRAASSDVLDAAMRTWFETWAALVRARDFVSARALFHDDVVGFGTRMHVVRGLDRLESQQWRHVWPAIEDFRFVLDELHCAASDDDRLAWAVVPWVSTGFQQDGAPFDRPGRATVIFMRAANDEPWRAIHTHISLAPGTPQRSFGRQG
jgi:ketosteroid isomerase-like protein